jgi:hypothetical protein
MTMSEVRSRLRKLGIETNRLLDISFPARNIIGLLVHMQFREELCATLKQASISVVTDFDPLHPDCVADPIHEGKAPIVRSQIAAELHEWRLIDTLRFLRPAIASNVGKYFISMGWMAEESLPTRMAYIDRDDPAEAFSSDAPAPGSPSPSPLATMTPVPAMVPTAVPMTAPASPAPSRQATPSRRATPSRSSTPSTPSTPTHGYNTRAKRNADAMEVARELSSSSDEDMAEDTHLDTYQ